MPHFTRGENVIYNNKKPAKVVLLMLNRVRIKFENGTEKDVTYDLVKPCSQELILRK